MQDRYLRFVRWSEEEGACVGYCPDLFPAGGVRHAVTSPEAYARLCEIVEDTVTTAKAQSISLPPQARPMRDVEVAA
jgi:hypothetical protein